MKNNSLLTLMRYSQPSSIAGAWGYPGSNLMQSIGG